MLFLPTFNKIGIKNLLELLFASCANNIATIVADKIEPDQYALLEQMNRRAQELGMHQTKFYDVIGTSIANRTSNQDIYRLARYLDTTFPKNRYFYHRKKVRYANLSVSNGNGLLWRPGGARGMLYCPLSHNHKILIALTKNKTSDFLLTTIGPQPYLPLLNDATKLLNVAKDSFTTLRVFASGKPVRVVPVYGGKRPSVAIGPTQDVYITTSSIDCCAGRAIDITVSYPERLWAPVLAQQHIGSMSVSLPSGEQRDFQLYTLLESIAESALARALDMVKLALQFSTKRDSAPVAPHQEDFDTLDTSSELQK